MVIAASAVTAPLAVAGGAFILIGAVTLGENLNSGMLTFLKKVQPRNLKHPMH